MSTEKRTHWDAVEAVDLAAYARVSALLLKHESTEAPSLLASVGLTAESWQRVRTEWAARIARHEDVRAAYVELYRTVGSRD